MFDFLPIPIINLIGIAILLILFYLLINWIADNLI
jgi:hypothetical protein